MDPLERSLRDARAHTLLLVSDLSDAQWMGPRLEIVNPPLWEVGHVGWFQELWTLRHAQGRAPLVAGSDALYDSAKVAHDTRWDLPLLDRALVVRYLASVLEQSIAALRTAPDEDAYFHQLSLFHEDMHGEAFAYTRQTLAYPDPWPAAQPAAGGPLPGDVEVQGARFRLGAEPGEDLAASGHDLAASGKDLAASGQDLAAPGKDLAASGEDLAASGEGRAPRADPSRRPSGSASGFVFDNEKWAHEVEVAPFRIARAPVTNDEFTAFVEAGGYRDERLWSAAGWRWRLQSGAQKPVYWERDGQSWVVRRYDAMRPLLPDHPVIHVSWYEAEAFSAWAGRRLPTETEWELAAATPEKRRFPWGDAAPGPTHANLDCRAGGTVPVGAHPEGDSACGCRQMIGNVWEWTATDFAPYPGFVVDPYQEYSQPWFGTHKVLRGGCWATRARLLRNTYRNFYTPDRRDVFAGFRTCAR